MRELNLSDPSLLEGSLVVSASAGSGKTFTLTVLVTASLGGGDIRAYEILATTFSEAATADLRERLLRPLDLLASLGLPQWEGLLPLLGTPDLAARESFLKALPLGERLTRSCMEVAQAAALWQAPAWAESPARAQAFWRRTRREAELLQVSTIHGLALGLLRQGGDAPEAILDTDHPALLRLLRQATRETLALPEDHPDHAAARALLAWAEQNWNAHWPWRSRPSRPSPGIPNRRRKPPAAKCATSRPRRSCPSPGPRRPWLGASAGREARAGWIRTRATTREASRRPS